MSTRQVPLLDLKAQYATIESEIQAAMEDVISSQHFILGPKVEELEKKIAEYCGVKYAVGCASGSDAILLSLMALDIDPGKAVVTTPYTFFATAGSIWRLGAKPVFVDIEPKTYNMNPEALKHLLDKECTSRSGKLHTKSGDEIVAVMPVHLFGQCADMDPILEIAGRYNLPVVEDAAQAVGAKYKDRPAGSIGALGCLSFFPSKNLGCYGDGGMVISNDKKLADRVRLLRTHGARQKYFHDEVGFNSRLDALQAAVLLAKLPYLDEWNRKRAENAAFYNAAFEGTSIGTPFCAEYSTHIYNQYVIRVSDRDGLKERLGKAGVGNAIYYPLSLHVQKCFSQLGHGEGDMPESEAASRETLSIPIYPEITRDLQEFVVKSVMR